MNAAAFNPSWLQAAGVGPNGKFHHVQNLHWGGETRIGAICAGLSLLALDTSRPLNRLNPDHRKCKACLKVLGGTEMTYGLDPKDGTADYDDRYLNARNAKPTKLGKRAQLELRLERHRIEADRLADKLAELEALPGEPLTEDNEPNVLWFRKVFQNGSREYTYAAVRCGDGLWYTTGPATPKGYDWDRLIEWIFDGESADIWWASEWEPLA